MLKTVSSFVNTVGVSTLTVTGNTYLATTSGSVGIGTTSPTSLLNVFSATNAQVVVQGNSTSTLVSERYSTDASCGLLVVRKYRGTLAAPTAVASGDSVGFVNFAAYGGTNSRVVGRVRCVVDTYTSDTNISAYLMFDTSSPGAATPTEKMRITATGNIYGTSGTAAMTDGFFYIPSAAGAPSGTPTSISGRVPMYYDSTNNDFYVYNGAWKKVTLA